MIRSIVFTSFSFAATALLILASSAAGPGIVA